MAILFKEMRAALAGIDAIIERLHFSGEEQILLIGPSVEDLCRRWVHIA